MGSQERSEPDTQQKLRCSDLHKHPGGRNWNVRINILCGCPCAARWNLGSLWIWLSLCQQFPPPSRECCETEAQNTRRVTGHRSARSCVNIKYFTHRTQNVPTRPTINLSPPACDPRKSAVTTRRSKGLSQQRLGVP